jgi:hypothetical protein
MICFLIPSIFSPIKAKKEYQTYIIQKEFVEEAYSNGTELDNIAMTQTIIEMNDWLINAKVNKKFYGNWSKYYNLDIDSLEPITAHRQDDDNLEG